MARRDVSLSRNDGKYTMLTQAAWAKTEGVEIMDKQ